MGEQLFPTSSHLLTRLDDVDLNEDWYFVIGNYLQARKSRVIFEQALLDRGYAIYDEGGDDPDTRQNTYKRDSGVFSVRAEVSQWKPQWSIHAQIEEDEIEQLVRPIKPHFGYRMFPGHNPSDIEMAEAQLKKYLEAKIVPRLIEAVSIPNDLFPSDAKGSAKK